MFNEKNAEGQFDKFCNRIFYLIEIKENLFIDNIFELPQTKILLQIFKPKNVCKIDMRFVILGKK